MDTSLYNLNPKFAYQEHILPAVQYLHRWCDKDTINAIVEQTATDDDFYLATDYLEEYGQNNGLPEGWWYTIADDETVWFLMAHEWVKELNDPAIYDVEYNKRTQYLSFCYEGIEDGAREWVQGEFEFDRMNNCYKYDYYALDRGCDITVYFE